MSGQKEQTQKLVQVDSDDAKWVDEHYPRGFWSWFVRSALRNFRELHEVTPDELVREGTKALKATPPPNTP